MNCCIQHDLWRSSTMNLIWNMYIEIYFILIFLSAQRAPWLRICIGSIFQTFSIKKFLINLEGRLTVLRNSSRSFQLSSKTFLEHYPMKSIFPQSRWKNTMFCVMYYFVRYIRHYIINGCEIVKTRPLSNLVYNTLGFIKWSEQATLAYRILIS